MTEATMTPAHQWLVDALAEHWYYPPRPEVATDDHSDEARQAWEAWHAACAEHAPEIVMPEGGVGLARRQVTSPEGEVFYHVVPVGSEGI